MSDITIGAFIGLVGVVIGFVFNLISENLRSKYELQKELRSKKHDVYLNIMEIIDCAKHGYEWAGLSKREIIKKYHTTLNLLALYGSSEVLKMYQEMYGYFVRKENGYNTTAIINKIRNELGNNFL